MYNYDNTLVQYQDPRLIERRDVYTSRPAYYVSKQTPVNPGVTLQSTFYNTGGIAQSVYAPQETVGRPLTVSPVRGGTTFLNMEAKEKATLPKSPIVKVKTEKQLYYPAAVAETEERVELPDELEYLCRSTYTPTYAKTATIDHYDYEKDRYYERRDRRYGKSAEEYRNERKTRTKNYDKYHKSYYVPTATNYVQPIATQTSVVHPVTTQTNVVHPVTTHTSYVQPVSSVPTQNLVPMYSHVPVYQSPPTYTTYQNVGTKYAQPVYYDRKGSGKL